ncbi:hypothetical protein AAMO2058_000354900, partial [Amorphochlora amoebiformis]
MKKSSGFFVLDSRNQGGKHQIDFHMKAHQAKLLAIKQRRKSTGSLNFVKGCQRRNSRKGRKGSISRNSSNSPLPTPRGIDMREPMSAKYSELWNRRKQRIREQKRIQHKEMVRKMHDRMSRGRSMSDRRRDPLDPFANPVRILRYASKKDRAGHEYDRTDHKEIYLMSPVRANLIPANKINVQRIRSLGVPTNTSPKTVQRQLMQRSRPYASRRHSFSLAAPAPTLELNRVSRRLSLNAGHTPRMIAVSADSSPVNSPVSSPKTSTASPKMYSKKFRKTRRLSVCSDSRHVRSTSVSPKSSKPRKLSITIPSSPRISSHSQPPSIGESMSPQSPNAPDTMVKRRSSISSMSVKNKSLSPKLKPMRRSHSAQISK